MAGILVYVYSAYARQTKRKMQRQFSNVPPSHHDITVVMVKATPPTSSNKTLYLTVGSDFTLTTI